MTRKRKNIKAILADPTLCKELVNGAVDFICKVEGIRSAELDGTNPTKQED